ncbi:hypothetical protein AciX8_0828 [Granulicella mallensis MP5ACTX8]|uniref:Uncharacterized protein n=1 Tax=Granulicella mallensis (strain ATCC BAA-1857 / DSM 23137 / MP5ACTX8) TaxID=682795 RepID=G8NSS8_GRAMM|nr:hypothetical protein AciX8_0828 [Granulicella mallensis MP5ACTX8]
METLGVLRLRVPKRRDASLRMTILWETQNKNYTCDDPDSFWKRDL